jgi:anti-sigma factor RsiW
VSAYLDGDLEAGACELIETHCRECADCAEIVAGLRETAGLCRQAGSLPVPETVRRRALARVRRLLDGRQHAASD